MARQLVTTRVLSAAVTYVPAIPPPVPPSTLDVPPDNTSTKEIRLARLRARASALLPETQQPLLPSHWPMCKDSVTSKTVLIVWVKILTIHYSAARLSGATASPTAPLRCRLVQLASTLTIVKNGSNVATLLAWNTALIKQW